MESQQSSPLTGAAVASPPVNDPKEQHPKPPFPSQQQAPPGNEQDLDPKADHGEHSYKGSGKLEGRVALITGADSGIGRAVAIAFAREGADVVVAYLNEDQDAQETAKWVKEAGKKVLTVAGNIGEEKHCQELIQKAVNEFGKIDILVNNAAHQQTFGSLEEIPSKEWEYTFQVNISSMFYLCKAAVPHMQPGSTIVNTASIQAYQPSPQLLAYATTKGAIVTFTKGLAQSLAEKGIRANCVAPGPVWTPLIPMSTPGESVSKFGKETPMERPAQPAELAPTYVFLASHDSSYITGAVVPVTGGKLLG